MISARQFAQLPPELRGELERRIKSARDIRTARRFLRDLHPKQRAFVLDASRRKVAVCSRLYPELQLKLREIDGQRLLIVGLTRHSIWLAGCKDQSEVGKFRGAGNGYKRVAIDEAQEYGAFLRDLITGAIEPALVDKKGQLLLAGTPGPIPAGIFYEVSTGDGGPQWPTHHWTIFDNPHIRDAEEEIRLFCATYGLDKDSATYRREYLGQWVRDEGALVYPYSANVNACRADEVPDGGHLVLSLDFGVVDATAFTLLKTIPGA